MTKYTPNVTIPYGYCHCGCGQKTNIATHTQRRSGAVKGQPNRYLYGHGHISNAATPLNERFWSKVDKSGGENSCWLWTAYRNEDGYGKIGWNGHAQSAHRISYLLTYGEIPDGLQVLHNCPEGDNPACVNPRHLWLGTHQDNMDDMARKGRRKSTSQPGEKHGRHKLTEQQVLEIRQRYALGGISQRALGELYGVAQWTVGLIVNHKHWRHVKA
jgi:hypothetical protein